MSINAQPDNLLIRIDFANHVTALVESAKDQLQLIALLALEASTTIKDNVSQHAHKASTKIMDIAVNVSVDVPLVMELKTVHHAT